MGDKNPRCVLTRITLARAWSWTQGLCGDGVIGADPGLNLQFRGKETLTRYFKRTHGYFKT